jgi:PPOX class probable F420-dependent enzyme
MTAPAAEFIAMGEEKFVSLTTFRRTGAPVSTPVWVARDGDTLVVTTPAGSGKVKRIRRDARVELRPCGRTGKVDPGAATVGGRAVVLDDPAAHDRVAGAVRRKYGLEYLLVMGVERVARRESRRVAVRISAG